eukprot:Gb_07870 [translate_table: standard]
MTVGVLLLATAGLYTSILIHCRLILLIQSSKGGVIWAGAVGSSCINRCATSCTRWYAAYAFAGAKDGRNDGWSMHTSRIIHTGNDTGLTVEGSAIFSTCLDRVLDLFKDLSPFHPFSLEHFSFMDKMGNIMKQRDNPGVYKSKSYKHCTDTCGLMSPSFLPASFLPFCTAINAAVWLYNYCCIPFSGADVICCMFFIGTDITVVSSLHHAYAGIF